MVRFDFLPFIIATLAISSHLAQAIRFSYPESADNAHSIGLSFVKGDAVNVTWNTVPTDPRKFSLYLWEFVTYPPAYELVAYNVDTKAKHATFKVPCNITSSSNWQLYEHDVHVHELDQSPPVMRYMLTTQPFITAP